MKSNNVSLRAIGLLLGAALVGVAILDTVPLYAQDADIKEQLQGVDLTGVKQLRLSPNGELAAGLTGLYENSGARSGSFSLVKIWAIKKQELLHQFRVPGKAYKVGFSPDGSTVFAADRTGNLGYVSTIRAWDLAEGTERKVGSCIGSIGEFCFSPDGSRLAALVKISYFEAAALLKETGVACVSQIKVWWVADEGKVLSINITDPRGGAVELWPSVKGAGARKRIDAAIRRIVPTKLRFSSDGKRLICETDAGVQRIYDSRTGKTLGPTNTSSVGMFMTILIIALHEVPADVTEFTVNLPQSGSPMLISRRADGWWQASRKGKVQKDVFKIDGRSYVAKEGGVEKRADISILLGLDDNMKLGELVSVTHPFGVIKIARGKSTLAFRLEEQKDGIATGTTLQRGEVRWATQVKK